MGHGGTCPHFYKWLGTGGTVSRITVEGHDQTIFPALRAVPVSPTFAPDWALQFEVRSGATAFTAIKTVLSMRCELLEVNLGTRGDGSAVVYRIRVPQSSD